MYTEEKNPKNLVTFSSYDFSNGIFRNHKPKIFREISSYLIKRYSILSINNNR